MRGRKTKHQLKSFVQSRRENVKSKTQGFTEAIFDGRNRVPRGNSFYAFNFVGSTARAEPCFDFTGTGRTSFATTTGNSTLGNITWHILSNGGDNSAQIYAFGRGDLESRDGVAPGYYDDDNRADGAVLRLSGYLEGDITFYIRPSTLATSNPSAFYGVRWGVSPDFPRIGDYDGDGRDDLTVTRRDSGNIVWFFLHSNTNTFSAVRFGLSSDMAANGADYNGDGRDEITVIRTYPNPQVRASTYFAGDSSTGALVLAQDWGSISDVYVIGDYLGDRRADFAVMRKRNFRHARAERNVAYSGKWRQRSNCDS